MNKIILKTMPVTTNRLYGFNNGRRYLLKEAGENKEAMKWELKAQWRDKDGCLEPLKGSVSVQIYLFFKDSRRRDIDNILKSLLDAGTGILWIDDSQISEIHLFKKIDKTIPRVEILIKE